MSTAGVTPWGIVLVLALMVPACAASDPEVVATTTTQRSPTTTSTTTTAPDRQASTTTTAFDPESVEGQVEAAYLKSWDVYANAVYNLELDEQALAAVYAEDHLTTKRDEIVGRIAERRAALVVVDHDYTIQFSDPATAVLIDRFRNHQVLVDPETKQPIERDPDVEVADVVTLKMFDSGWRVTRKERLG